jgi:hypothetical protein
MTVTRGHGTETDEMIEQAYRRGYMQGFFNALELSPEKHSIGKFMVHGWRYLKNPMMIPPPGSSQGEKI